MAVILLTSTLTFGNPPSADDANTRAALLAVHKRVTVLEKMCGADVADSRCGPAIAHARRTAPPSMLPRLNKLQSHFDGRFDRIEKLLRRSRGGGTSCTMAMSALVQLEENSETNKDASSASLKLAIGEMCKKGEGDTTDIMGKCLERGTAECIRGANGSWVIRPLVPIAPTVLRSYREIDADKEVKIKELSVPAPTVAADSGDSGLWRIGTWGAMPIAGFAIGWGAGAAANPDGTDNNGDFNHNAGLKGAVIGLGAGLGGALVTELIVWLVKRK